LSWGFSQPVPSPPTPPILSPPLKQLGDKSDGNQYVLLFVYCKQLIKKVEIAVRNNCEMLDIGIDSEPINSGKSSNQL